MKTTTRKNPRRVYFADSQIIIKYYGGKSGWKRAVRTWQYPREKMRFARPAAN